MPRIIEGYSLMNKEWKSIDKIDLNPREKIIRKEIIVWYYEFISQECCKEVYSLLKAGFHLVSLYIQDFEIHEYEVTTIALAALHIVHSLLGQSGNEDMDISKYTSFRVFKELQKPYSPKLEICPDELWRIELRFLRYPIHKLLMYLELEELNEQEYINNIIELLSEINQLTYSNLSENEPE